MITLVPSQGGPLLEYVQILKGYEGYLREFFILDSCKIAEALI